MTTDWPYPFWIAHRGAGKLAPENTLAAFRLGAQHGWRMFECDAKLSADGVPFLLHDSTLERTTSGQGTAGDLAWSTLAQLDSGSWHSRAYVGEPIPTLENAARWCLANGHFLDIEIKPTPGEEERTGQVVAQLAARLWAQASTPPLLTSFRPESLLGAVKAAPQLPRGLLLDTLWDDWSDYAQQLQCAAVVCQHALWDAALVARVKAMGMRCLSYTVNDESTAERLISLGTDGIVSDRVDLFVPG
ncbi:glycerophosphodiester phosphodiesterase [Ottowia thiooxydans]|uniref:glycerophosphodiester phosphodiesterase n=1 Tax=Ottowia thiooxydans TaxID=219182 RepID=UPI00040FC876|nr:glycerophosphodiester phosphodiesterase [Ottowia thiooxydans]